MLGQVIYCQRVCSERFFVGLKFSDKHIPWSILQRFNGLAHTDIMGAMRWSDDSTRALSAAELRAVRKHEPE